MMFRKITPEQAGISSSCVLQFIRSLESRGLVMHSVLMMRGNDIFAEYYWKPFHKDFCHRMYSQTKSFVGVAIGLLEEDGLLQLDDPVSLYFPEKIDRELPTFLKNLTIRQMLTMQTCGTTGKWFFRPDPDRTHLYFAENTADHPGGMVFAYDSPGTQVLSVLVEKLSRMSLFDFLNERIFKRLGTFQTATILKTRTTDSFGDSALLCTTRDMASFARFVMNYGTWNGQRLMNENYLRTATSRLVDNNRSGFYEAFTDGYGYQIWCTRYNGFAFNGMGCQLTICIPEKDFIFSCTADNQGFAAAKDLILGALYEQIIEQLQPNPLPGNMALYQQCVDMEESLELATLKGGTSSAYAKVLHGKTYICRDNPAQIREFAFSFLSEDVGEIRYVNAQGEKRLRFGLGKNVFGKFPQYGYSTLHAGLPNWDGYLYDCAASAAWCEPQKLQIKVQIIDQYFGNLFLTFSFRDNLAYVTMEKAAEAFLEEYQGTFVAQTLGT